MTACEKCQTAAEDYELQDALVTLGGVPMFRARLDAACLKALHRHLDGFMADMRAETPSASPSPVSSRRPPST